mgnify:CR=1 FL=1
MKISKAEWAAILAACIVVAFSLGYYLGRSASPAVQTANGRAVSVSRSGRVYAEEELRRQIR